MISNSARRALVVSAVALSLSSCGGSQPPIGATGAIQQRNVAEVRSAGNSDLIFASADFNGSGYSMFVWSYPRGRFVKELAKDLAGRYLCSDKAGDVWLTDGGSLVELDHSGNVEKRLYEYYNGDADACSVDPSTGNVAAINRNGDFVVYANASGSGTIYQTYLYRGSSCAYDDRGNLFGYGYDRNYNAHLVELPKGGETVEDLYFNQRVAGDESIQWDGKYLALQVGAKNDHTVVIDRIKVTGINAKVIGTTLLVSPRKVAVDLPQFWIQRGTVMESTGYDAKEIGLWKYPDGGKPERLIRGSGGSHAYYIYGITVSVAPK
jgi:hypothetical protein